MLFCTLVAASAKTEQRKNDFGPPRRATTGKMFGSALAGGRPAITAQLLGRR
jgi:hypothetical protein